MRYPSFLEKNGRVGFIAPSFGCATEPYESRFKNALAIFKDEGYEVVLGPNCFLSCGVGKSNTPEKCGEEINDFLKNDKSDILISCGGGELMCEDLPFVDFEGIKKAKPKWYLGYSDNTNLTFLLNTLCDTASIYGPCAAAFGDEPRLDYVKDTLDILTGTKLSVHNYETWGLPGDDEEIILMPYRQQRYLRSEVGPRALSGDLNFSGRLIGGCMDCLQTLVGTKFDRVNDFLEKYKEDGFVWFLEACDFNVMDIRRCLWQMENAGWFKYVKGFIFGRPMHFYDEFDGFDHIEAAREFLEKYDVPMIMDIDLGHLAPSMPIISGAMAEVHTKENTIRIDYILK